MNPSFYSKEELTALGIKTVGDDVFISRKASIYDAHHLTIGHHVRIDDFCILSGTIRIGNYVHISAFVALYGKQGIEFGNFSGASPRTTIFSAVDDFSGEYMIGPLVPSKFTKRREGKVKIFDYAQIGAGSIIMPALTIGEGAVTGALTLVKDDIPPWTIVAGIPARILKQRAKTLLNYAQQIE